MNRVTLTLLKLSQRACGPRVYTMHFGLARGLKRRYGQGFKPNFTQSSEERFLEQLNFTGKTAYDIGGYIGMVTLFFARAVGPHGRIVVFEPNPQNFAEVQFNVNVNHMTNVTALPIGLGAVAGTMSLQVHPVYPSRSTFLPRWVSNVTALKCIDVTVDTLDHQIETQPLPPPDFVKMDVEGFEWEVLQGMQHTLTRCHPALFIEIHGPLKAALVNNLLGHGYRVQHIEAQCAITTSEGLTLAGGHIYAARGPA